MKTRTVVISLLLLVSAVGMSAQPRSLGGRIGMTGFDIAYLHTVGKTDFIETDLSLDFGYGGSGAPGIKATGIYNFVVARPAWTDKGSWAIYTGPGLSLGYVQDRVLYKNGNIRFHPNDYGFMISVAIQAGLEYTFWFPLQIAVDLRPQFGMHVNNGIKSRLDAFTDRVDWPGKAGWYDNGWYGFVPTLSFRYRF